MDNREIKALQIAATMPIRRDTYGWIVPSQSEKRNYKVATVRPEWARADRGFCLYECNCPDFELRGQPCKHIMAVEFTTRREVTATGETITQEMKVTYTQNWAAYNAAQCEEKERFMPMLADLCSTIRQHKQGRGRPRLPMSDMAFEAVSKVYSGLSARRFDSDVSKNATKGLTAQDPHFNSVLGYMRSPEMTPILKHLVELSALPLKGVETDFAVDSTGFSTCRYIRWYDHKWGREMTKREWVKLHAMTGVRTNIVTSVEMTGYKGAGSNDSKQFQPLVATTAENFTIGDVTADKAYLGRSNLDYVEKFGGTPYIPFKTDSAAYLIDPEPPASEATAWVRMFHMFAYQRDMFLARYHQRSNVETTFSMIKAKFGDSLRCKSDVGQFNEVLCKVIAHNLCVLISCIHEIGLPMPEFEDGTVAI